MANQEHLDILKQGVLMWNKWRLEHSDIWPDLSGADLSFVYLGYANLSRINLSRTHLNGAHLNDANLSGADLSHVSLNYANLIRADLSGANLSGANLSYVNLSKANLSRADLSGANLSSVNLSSAILSSANFSKAWMEWTIFDNVDLRKVKGLKAVKHHGPSTIGLDTIYRSHGQIPELFLRQAGVPETFLTNMRSLIESMSPIDFYSCFISYSSKDEAFAKRLHAGLQSKGVRCWFAPEDLKIGAKIRPSIDESIRLHDKLLLVLSQSSVTSQWVEQEVERALARERKENKVILFPICLDQAVMELEEGWPALIRNTRNIGDFTRWKRLDAYQKALDRLLRDLKAEA